MKKLRSKNINTPKYWNNHQTATDFGLRQKEYKKLVKGKVVDLGCGLSPFVSVVHGVGVDFSPVTISKCRELYPDTEFVHSRVTHTPFKDKEFDTSVAGEVIEHLENPKDLIDEMVRITKKRIIISTPILEFDDKEHLWEFSAKDLMKLLPNGKVKTIESKRFQGRKYLIAYYDL